MKTAGGREIMTINYAVNPNFDRVKEALNKRPTEDATKKLYNQWIKMGAPIIEGKATDEDKTKTFVIAKEDLEVFYMPANLTLTPLDMRDLDTDKVINDMGEKYIEGYFLGVQRESDGLELEEV